MERSQRTLDTLYAAVGSGPKTIADCAVQPWLLNFTTVLNGSISGGLRLSCIVMAVVYTSPQDRCHEIFLPTDGSGPSTVHGVGTGLMRARLLERCGLLLQLLCRLAYTLV